ncbi:aspartate/glutamate racemase family protein [Bradyrhizobium sp. LHD-71]|uniref:aspartate/glutamate racemase family protein n=1 Tax=Bradyrhizobium sp. LHD-71 TaxID=3072141 RepID=UPI00280DA1A3|nr:aspartate/glutamate racemase family protein [Bradyrhizobium sp. LHD-71]MDQ8727129.1 aspartate/glutamate racemase family protein [Bradyrhizobium sp. LHD-71]
MTRIALIHAVAVAIDPVKEAFAELWPDADLVNVFDDSLSVDRARDEALTPTMRRRIADLGRYALSTGAHGVLYTCSAFGSAIDAFAASAGRPVLKPNEAMFGRALAAGRRIGMLATFKPSVDSMEEEFRTLAAATGSQASIETVLVEEAMVALKEGDADTHNRLLAEAAPRLDGCDAIMLAHFSTSRAFAAVSRTSQLPVLTSPRAAVEELRARC